MNSLQWNPKLYTPPAAAERAQLVELAMPAQPQETEHQPPSKQAPPEYQSPSPAQQSPTPAMSPT